MVSRFHDKFNEDLELIYAKYSNPFDGAPELILSTCDLPGNVQILENYKYSNCGKWKVLGTDSHDVYDNSCNTSLDGNNVGSSDEENHYSHYESDEQSSSDCSGSFKLEKSFREKYPRSCAKKNVKTTPYDTKSKKSTGVPKTPPGDNKIWNLAHKQCHYDEEWSSSEIMLNRHSSDKYFKSQGTVTISKDLWTQVQQCLRLMTGVFSKLNGECDDEHDLEKLCNERPSQRQPSSIRRSSVKQRLFCDDNASRVPQGLVVEKLFVKHKGSNGQGVELSSRQTFLHDTESKISEIESLDSGFCQEKSSDASTQEYSSTSSRMSGSTSQTTMVSQTSEGSCCETSYLKSSMANSFMKSAAGSKQCRDSLSGLQPSLKIFAEPIQASSDKNRRRRYRLVRRRSSSRKRQGRSTSETTGSEHESDSRENHHVARNEHYPRLSTGTSEHESDTRESHYMAKNEHSFDQCLSDTDDVPEKTTAVNGNIQNKRCSSPQLYDVMLLEAPLTPVIDNKFESRGNPRNKTTLLTTSSQENCRSSTSRITTRSSTPRKHPGQMNVTTSPDPEIYLGRPLFQQLSNTSESMPSPIRYTLNTNPSETSVNNTFTRNTDHQTLSSHQPPNIKDLLPSPICLKSSCSILQPEISVNFLRTKDILERKYSTGSNETEPNIQSEKNNDGYTKKRFSADCNTLPYHIPSDYQNVEQDYLSNKGHSKKNQHGNMMQCNDRSSSSTRSPKVICCRETFSEPGRGRSKSRRVLCGTDSNIISEKLNRYNSDKLASPKNHQQSLHPKTTPRRAKFHPYATCNKFPRTPSLTSPFQSLSIRSPSMTSPLRDLTIKSPSSPRHKWTTLDRSPMVMCVKEARRISDPVAASRKILEFGSHGPCRDFSSDGKIKSRENESEGSLKHRRKTMKRTDCRVEDNSESRSNCSNGKCSKTFCFNCSMDLS